MYDIEYIMNTDVLYLYNLQFIGDKMENKIKSMIGNTLEREEYFRKYWDENKDEEEGVISSESVQEIIEQLCEEFKYEVPNFETILKERSSVDIKINPKFETLSIDMFYLFMRWFLQSLINTENELKEESEEEESL